MYLDIGVQGATVQFLILELDVLQIDLRAAHHDPSQRGLLGAETLKNNQNKLTRGHQVSTRHIDTLLALYECVSWTDWRVSLSWTDGRVPLSWTDGRVSKVYLSFYFIHFISHYFVLSFLL